MIPVMKPLLVGHERVLPYLAEIDRNRWYTNFGPLCSRFEQALGEHWLGDGAGAACTVANGTFGLLVALLAQGAQPGGYCVMPAWTFPASALAVTQAGMKPFFVDIDPETGVLDEEEVRRTLRQMKAAVGAVLVVAPFGAPLDAAPWEVLARETGIAVVIDAAAGFDSLRPSTLPAVVSLHATKAFGIGEGGAVVARDAELVQRCRVHSNFGFDGKREASVVGVNGKLSEYGAAIGLATLDAWPDTRRRWQAVAGAYRERLAGLDGELGLAAGYGGDWISSTLVVTLLRPEADGLARFLRARGIETRRWWMQGCHRQPAFQAFPAGRLRCTDDAAARTLGLPLYLDLGVAQIEHVCDSVRTYFEVPDRARRAAGPRHLGVAGAG